MPQVELVGRNVIEDETAPGPEQGAEGKLLVVRSNLHKAGLALHLDLGVEHATVPLPTLEGVHLRPMCGEKDRKMTKEC